MARMARFKPIYSRKSETIDSWTTCTCNVSESLFRSKSHFLPRLTRMEPEGNGQYTTVLQQGRGEGQGINRDVDYNGFLQRRELIQTD